MKAEKIIGLILLISLFPVLLTYNFIINTYGSGSIIGFLSSIISISYTIFVFAACDVIGRIWIGARIDREKALNDRLEAIERKL